jgi:putative alpha-1,2-mannosidase
VSRIAVVIAAAALTLPGVASADPAQYVRPLSGTLGSGFPMVGASVPFGLIQPGPDTGLADGSEDPVNYCGYGYQDPTIRGFSLTHFDGAGIKIAGDVPFMPVTGTPSRDSRTPRRTSTRPRSPSPATTR